MAKTCEQIFGEQLRRRRRALHMTQRALAERLGYSEKAVSKWEQGYVAPGALLPALADALHCSIDELLREETAPCYFLGIDGGGTKTEFLLCDSEGQALAHTLLGACNPNDVGADRTKQVLREGILQVCGSLSPRKISVFAGIAGGITGDNRTMIADLLSEFRFGRADNGSDAQSAVALALGEEDGTAVIAGTGSIAFTQLAGKQYRFGGYGYLLEEGGSGFAIGRDAIRAALSCEEDGTAPTPLYKAVREQCGRATVGDALGTLYAGGKRAFASFAPAVFAAHRAGDPTATEILRQHAAVMARLIQNAARPFGGRDHKVILVGGLLNHGDILLPLIGAALPRELSVHLSATTAPVVHGALYLAGLRTKIKKETAPC